MRMARSLLYGMGSDILMGGVVMRIQAKPVVTLTVVILLNACVGVARADEGVPLAPTALSGDPCGTLPRDEDVRCRVAASDQPVTSSNFEDPNADPQRNERPGDVPEAAKGALAGGLTVVAVILKLGPIGWALCAIGGAYCAAAVLVGAVAGGTIAHIRRPA
jgi:hypothetical protein